MSCALEDKTKMSVLLVDNNNFCRIHKSLSHQYSDSKFWDRWIWANSTDPHQTAQTKVRIKVTEMYIYAISGSLLFATLFASFKGFTNLFIRTLQQIYF